MLLSSDGSHTRYGVSARWNLPNPSPATCGKCSVSLFRTWKRSKPRSRALEVKAPGGDRSGTHTAPHGLHRSCVQFRGQASPSKIHRSFKCSVVVSALACHTGRAQGR